MHRRQHQPQRQLVLLLLLLTAAWQAWASVGWHWAIVIDAGSTGSRVHVFRYYTAAARGGLLPTVDLPEAVHKTTPGLSAYAFAPATAAASLQPLLKFARDKVPSDQWAATPIQLLATAGLRMLSNSSADAILDEVGKLLAGSGFNASEPGAVRVLSGSDEGVWAWVAANFATGALQAAIQQPQQPPPAPPPRPQAGRKAAPGARAAAGGGGSASSWASAAPPLQGILELGGGSLQVTLLAGKPLPPGQAAPLQLPRLGAGRLFSRSYDGWGLQAAQARHAAALAAGSAKADPCLPSGFRPSSGKGLPGGGSWAQCKASVAKLLPARRGKCGFEACGLNGTDFLPRLDGVVFLGLENLHYTSRLLGLSPSQRASLASLDAAAGAFCGRSWEQLQASYLRHEPAGQREDSYVLKVCFSGALIVSLLGESGLRLPRQAPIITPSNSVTTPRGLSVEARWPLGALVTRVISLGGLPLGAGGQQPWVPWQRPRSHAHGFLGADGSWSDGAAAAAAAAFCLALLAASAMLSWLGVGVGGAAGGGVSSSSGPPGAAAGHGPKYSRLRPASRGGPQRASSPPAGAERGGLGTVVELAAVAAGSAASGGGAGSAGGSSSSVRSGGGARQR